MYMCVYFTGFDIKETRDNGLYSVTIKNRSKGDTGTIEENKEVSP